jgi:hypothetical protein
MHFVFPLTSGTAEKHQEGKNHHNFVMRALKHEK